MTPEHREELEFIGRCDPTFLITHVKERTSFDAKLLERVFELAKTQARTLLAQTSDAANGAMGEQEALLRKIRIACESRFVKMGGDYELGANQVARDVVRLLDQSRAALTAQKVAGQVKPAPSAEIDLSAGNWAPVFHAAFRHAGNSPRANRIHAEIADMPDREWLDIVDYVLIGIRRKLKDKKS